VIRRIAPSVLLVMLLAPGCGKQTADQWLKEKLFPPTPAQRVLELESPRADVRREAVLAIEARTDTHKIASVVRLMCLLAKSDPDPMVRASACRVLGRMKGEDVVRTLSLIVSKDRDDYVRTDAAAALGRQGAPEGLPALAGALQNDKDVDVRVAAAEGLRFIRSKEAAEALAAGVASTDIAVARRCWESLRYMTGQDLPCQGEPWTTYLAAAENPLAGYGKPPAMPKGASQRPQFTQGIGQFVGGLFKRDVHEVELE
jgi:hypothetical protein